MEDNYFRRVARQTGTRFWINNPTGEEIDLARAAGAIGCTTNPGYGAALLDREPAYIGEVIDRALRETAGDDTAADRVYEVAVERVRDKFLPLYEQSGGTAGFAIIQGDPRHDGDVDFIVAEALRHRRLGPSIMIKLPANSAGARALEILVGYDTPTCVTEVLGVGQAVMIWEAYRRAANATGKRPPLYVTHITGVLNRYLAAQAEKQGIAIAPDVIAQAGWAVAREEHRVFKERNYDGAVLIGGAVAPEYFTEMVGADIDVTIDWVSAAKLLADDPAITDRFHAGSPPEAVAELREKLPDFRRSLDADALVPEDLPGYGPLQFFRDGFLQRYGRLVTAVAERRAGSLR